MDTTNLFTSSTRGLRTLIALLTLRLMTCAIHLKCKNPNGEFVFKPCLSLNSETAGGLLDPLSVVIDTTLTGCRSLRLSLIEI